MTNEKNGNLYSTYEADIDSRYINLHSL